jgi:hypothetical protein
MSKKSRWRREQQKLRTSRPQAEDVEHDAFVASFDLTLVTLKMIDVMSRSPEILHFEWRLQVKHRIRRLDANFAQTIHRSESAKTDRFAESREANKNKETKKRRQHIVRLKTPEIESLAKELQKDRDPIPKYSYCDSRRSDNPAIFLSSQADSVVRRRIRQYGSISAFQVA